jgi:arabinogalactan endo-1,4-beta-galactosidase
MIHVDRGGDKDSCRWFFDKLLAEGVEFDVIGLSYYPFWHGTLDDLRENLSFLAARYDKDIIVVETGCNWEEGWWAIKKDGPPDPATPEGQRLFLDELIRVVRATPKGRGKGVFYWAPEWVRDGGPWNRRALFDENGEALPGMAAFAE